MTITGSPQGCCSNCAYFRNDAEFIERTFPGLGSLSSAHGSTRGDDGICLRHDRYLSAHSSCEAFRFRSNNDEPPNYCHSNRPALVGAIDCFVNPRKSLDKSDPLD
jgi:hypothetical protein